MALTHGCLGWPRTRDPIIAEHTDGNFRVSTCLLPIDGLCHSELANIFDGNRYETCVFAPNGDSEVVERYPTLRCAKAGHAHWRKLVRRRFCLEWLRDIVDLLFQDKLWQL